jgi:multiple RNA-binding domain-containing protein 1
VKGLPANMQESRLRQMFADFGTVTDCKLKYTDDGRFRRFAFVGFDNEHDANNARIHFNQTFINASRIQVRTYLW